MITIGKEYRFEAGHQLWDESLTPEENKDVFGKCTSQHGHSYAFTVEISGELIDGMVLNYYDLDKICKPIADYLDHCEDTLNGLPEFEGLLTSAENIAWWIASKVEEELNLLYGHIRLESVTVKETARTFAKVS